MSKKDRNMKEIKEYLSGAFPGLQISSKAMKGTMEDRPPQLFYTFQVGDDYLLALVRAVVEEETPFPVLEGKNVAEELRKHPNVYVVVDKGPAGEGTEVKTSDIDFSAA
jgi:hypothetical protein